MKDITLLSKDGTPLSAVLFEPPKKPVAVMSLVHGFGEHCRRYGPMVDYLRGHNIAVVALDLRGHGQSGGKRGVCRDYTRFREDVTALVTQSTHTYPDLPHILYGHSMGGALVLNYILQDGANAAVLAPRFSAIVCSAPLLELAEPIPGVLQSIVRMLRKIAPNLTLGQPISGEKVSSLAEEQKIYETDPANHGRLGVGLAVGMVEAGEWVLDHAGDWKLPLLLMHARQDQLTAFSASEAFASKAKNCHFIPFDNVEHEIHNDKTRSEVYKNMSDFIKRHI